jgi:LPXTG-motif cell wall-anchored protein
MRWQNARTRWSFVALISLVLFAVVSIGAKSADADADPKVYVCKYVGTPGVDERLQTGQNPIEVSVNATGGTAIGSYFADAHGRSYLLGIVPIVPEPSRANCPPPDVPEVGRVEVTKVVVGEGAPAGVVFAISLTPQGGSAITKSITGAGVVVFEGLEPGVYALSESDPGSEWDVSYSSTSISVEAGETATATVANTYTHQVAPPEPGSVVVTKIVTGAPPATTYEIGLVGPAPAQTERWLTIVGAGTVTFSALPIGSYNVVEGDPGEGYTMTIAPNTVVVTSGAVANATVTNTYVEQASSPPTMPPTTEVGGTGAQVSEPAPTGQLPKTGTGVQWAIVAMTLVAGGAAMTAISRRRAS